MSELADHELQLKAVVLRRAMLQILVNAGAGHTGGGLSCMAILNVLDNSLSQQTRNLDCRKCDGRRIFWQVKCYKR
jgi:transketolase N-terminal domain/subunit